jgi:hypothetical protein
MQGTVPYLGTFLTDLMMIDTVTPDFVEVGRLMEKCVAPIVYGILS